MKCALSITIVLMLTGGVMAQTYDKLPDPIYNFPGCGNTTTKPTVPWKMAFPETEAKLKIIPSLIPGGTGHKEYLNTLNANLAGIPEIKKAIEKDFEGKVFISFIAGVHVISKEKNDTYYEFTVEARTGDSSTLPILCTGYVTMKSPMVAWENLYKGQISLEWCIDKVESVVYMQEGNDATKHRCEVIMRIKPLRWSPRKIDTNVPKTAESVSSIQVRCWDKKPAPVVFTTLDKVFPGADKAQRRRIPLSFALTPLYCEMPLEMYDTFLTEHLKQYEGCIAVGLVEIHAYDVSCDYLYDLIYPKYGLSYEKLKDHGTWLVEMAVCNGKLIPLRYQLTGLPRPVAKKPEGQMDKCMPFQLDKWGTTTQSTQPGEKGYVGIGTAGNF